MRFKSLLDTWSSKRPTELSDERYSIRLSLDDAARVHALAELFSGIGEEQIVSELLSAALDELQTSMPYQAGERVIREDDFGDPVYEDAGMTPRFLELVRQHRARLAGG
ncbi:MAG: pilin assembly protein [Woeseia sp.]